MRLDGEAWASSHPVLRRVRLRVTAGTLLQAVSVGLGAAAVVVLLGRAAAVWSVTTMWGATGIATCAAALWFVYRRGQRTLTAAGAAIERTSDHFHNVIATAIELSAHPQRTPAWVRQRVFADADALLGRVDADAIANVRGPLAMLLIALAVLTTVSLGLHERAAQSVRTLVQRSGEDAPASAANGITVTIHPPAYTGRPLVRVPNPERIDAIEGSRLQIDAPPYSSVRFGSRSLPATHNADGTSTMMSLEETGYLAVTSSRGVSLIPVNVAPDRPPVIRVDQPGRDVVVFDASSPIGVMATVTDDFGIADVALRYTRISGSGEQFDFREGELPLTSAKQDPSAWNMRGTFSLSSLALEPGEAIVYQFVARDSRVGTRGTTVSDSFLIERAGPGQVALDGFAMPPEGERYALSQQMIVLKIERLRGEEGRLAQAAVQERAADIAAEQRAVKANFVFLMGGHVEDEELEAEQSSEIQEGRLQNTARQEMQRAIEHMTHTERALALVDTGTALRQARLAVEFLQRAFGQNRYILRTVARRDRIDPARRLSGSSDAARSSRRSSNPSEADAKSAEIRRLFDSSLAVLADLRAARPIDARLLDLSERALRIDPTNPTWQRLARDLMLLRARVAAGENREATASRVREAIALIASEAGRAGLDPAFVPDASTLRGSWADALPPPTRK
jgi:hypothetical protein